MSDRIEGELSDLYGATESELRASRGAFVASLIGKELVLKFQECVRKLVNETLTREQRATVLLDLIKSGRVTSGEVHLFASALIRANEVFYASLAKRILGDDEIALGEDDARSMVDLDPENWTYLLLYGTALLFSVPKQPKTAHKYLALALERCPEVDRGGILSYLAMAAMFSEDFSGARFWIKQTLEIDPSQIRCRRVEFMVGFYAGAPWPEVWENDFEWRWHGYVGQRPPIPKEKLWDGSPLAGRRILLAGEGGLGDQIQFVRYASLLAPQGPVVVACDRRIMPLVANMAGIDSTVETERLSNAFPADVDYDVAIPMMSLPGTLRTTPESLPAVPHFQIPPERIENARGRMTHGTLNIGICWRSANDRARCIPLEEFSRIADIPSVNLYSLERAGNNESERDAVGQNVDQAEFGLTDLEDGPADILNTAASIRALDLVITTDGMIAHLAGALAKPVYMATLHMPDWRWGLGMETTPWYPTMRMFRQPTFGDWKSVFSRIVEAVKRDWEL
jgi:hypothetical protein